MPVSGLAFLVKKKVHTMLAGSEILRPRICAEVIISQLRWKSDEWVRCSSIVRGKVKKQRREQTQKGVWRNIDNFTYHFQGVPPDVDLCGVCLQIANYTRDFIVAIEPQELNAIEKFKNVVQVRLVFAYNRVFLKKIRKLLFISLICLTIILVSQ